MRNILTRAAEMIEKRGWDPHAVYLQPQLCVLMAIQEAADEVHWDYRRRFEEQHAAMLSVLETANFQRIPGRRIGVSVLRWEQTPGRSKDEVVRVLRAAARKIVT
jgi:hypothetical protein